MGLSWDYKATLAGSNMQMCSQYNVYGLPMRECLFSQILFTIHFNDFEVEILNHL